MNAAATVLRGDNRSKLDLANLKWLHDGALTAADQLWKTSATELERLLVVRIGGFKTKLWSALAVSLGTTLLALVFAWSLSGSIIRAIRGLVAGVDQLTDGDMKAAVPHADGRDEIADVARAIARFRDHTIGVLTEANSTEREEAIRRTQREALGAIAEEVRGSWRASPARSAERASDARLDLDGCRQRDKTRDQIATVVSDLDQTSRDIKVVASAVHELARSINEISGQTSQVARSPATPRSGPRPPRPRPSSSRPTPSRSARWPASSRRSRNRPICSRSMRQSRPPAPAMPAAALPWSPRR